MNKKLRFIVVIAIVFSLFTGGAFALETPFAIEEIEKDFDIEEIQEYFYRYFDIEEYFNSLTKHGLDAKIIKLKPGAYHTIVDGNELVIYDNFTSRDELLENFPKQKMVNVDLIEIEGKPFLNITDMKDAYGFNEDVTYKNVFLNFKNKGEVYEEVTSNIYRTMYGDYGKSEINFEEVGSDYFFDVSLNIEQHKYSRDIYLNAKHYILPFKLRTKYHIWDHIVKLDDFNFQGVTATHDWHVMQHFSGNFSDSNCFPASVVQAFNLISPDHKVDTDYVRKEIKTEEGGGTRFSYVKKGKLRIAFWELKEYTLENIDKLLEEGNLIIIGVKSDKYYERSEAQKTNTGHAITVYGYIDFQGQRYYKIQDTGKLSGSHNFITKERLEENIVSNYGNPVYTNKERLEDYLVKYNLLD